jgi:hypothetical protein
MILDEIHKYLNQKHLQQSCWRTPVKKRPEMVEKEGNLAAHPNARGVLANSFRPKDAGLRRAKGASAPQAGGDAAAPMHREQARHPYLLRRRRDPRGKAV